MLTGKRIVVASEMGVGSTGAGLVHGLRRERWAVHEIDPRLIFTQSRRRASRAFARLTKPWSQRDYNAAILEAASRVEAQAFLAVKGTYVTAGTLQALRQRSTATVMYYPDYHFGYAGVDEAAFEHYDLFVTSKAFQVDWLRERLGKDRTMHVHHGYCDDVHVPWQTRDMALDRAVNGHGDTVCDVSYVGNFAPNKERWLAGIIRRLPHVRLRIVGSRWEVAQDPAVRACAFGAVLDGDFLGRVIALSRINLAVHGPPAPGSGWQDAVSTRTFEIPACKGFMLHVDSAEVRALFEPGREIDVFGDADELAAKIEHYLAYPDLRREMAERAYARAVPAYGYDARAAEISRRLQSIIASGASGGDPAPPAAQMAGHVS